MATRRLAALLVPALIAAGFVTHAVGATGSQPHLGNLDGPVYALATHAGRLVVGGEFTRAGNAAVTHLAAWDGQGWTAFPPLDGPVWALVELGGDLVVGGAFTTAGGVPAAHVARWDGSAWHALGLGTDADVRCFLVQAGVLLFVGGDFTTAGGLTARGVARWVGNTWTPLGQGLDGSVRALAMHGGQVVAGGDFSTHEGSGFERHIATFEGPGANWVALAPGIDGAVHALATYQGALVMAGDFRQADWVTPAAHIARLVGFGENWSRVGFGFGANDSLDTESVHALHVDGDVLFAGGAFTQADLQDANHVTRFDGIGWSEVAGGMNAAVHALGGFGSSVIAGGDFMLAGGQPAAHVAAFDGLQWAPLIETPIVVADFTATALAGQAQLAWRLAALAGIRTVTVERAAQDTGPFEALARLAPESEMAFVDAAAPGSAWYRLVLETDDGGRWFAGPVHAGAAAGTRLQLHATMQSNGALAVRYTLVQSSDMALDLFDVRGRLVHRLDAGHRLAGERALVWDRHGVAGRRIPRGTYWLQLRAGEDRVTRRVGFFLY